jgi:hypothetical protein
VLILWVWLAAQDNLPSPLVLPILLLLPGLAMLLLLVSLLLLIFMDPAMANTRTKAMPLLNPKALAMTRWSNLRPERR